MITSLLLPCIEPGSTVQTQGNISTRTLSVPVAAIAVANSTAGTVSTACSTTYSSRVLNVKLTRPLTCSSASCNMKGSEEGVGVIVCWSCLVPRASRPFMLLPNTHMYPRGQGQALLFCPAQHCLDVCQSQLAIQSQKHCRVHEIRHRIQPVSQSNRPAAAPSVFLS